MTSQSVENKIDEGTQMRKLVPVQVPALQPPHYVDTSTVFGQSNTSYHSLGHCLRTNIFPGAPLVWSSLVQDSYVNHPLPSQPIDPKKWYGRRTDDMVRWTERNIVNQRLKKALTQMDKKSA
ncbi:ciliary microtubule inner protein 4 [Engraulis encrasicolus]|uniref:ciliary microtubule inner protein 4 n=1 Tax=Engraulis encrasicolus TaxID=184585 RepID=UPI002FD78EFB